MTTTQSHWLSDSQAGNKKKHPISHSKHSPKTNINITHTISELNNKTDRMSSLNNTGKITVISSSVISFSQRSGCGHAFVHFVPRFSRCWPKLFSPRSTLRNCFSEWKSYHVMRKWGGNDAAAISALGLRIRVEFFDSAAMFQRTGCRGKWVSERKSMESPTCQLSNTDHGLARTLNQYYFRVTSSMIP